MKKTLKFVGIAIFSMATVFTSCKTESDVGAPAEIQAKAYPGFNQIVFTPAMNMLVQRDDGKSFKSSDFINNTMLLDKDIQDGVEYTYTFHLNELYSGTSVKNSNPSVKVKAIKPPYFTDKGMTSTLDLASYESGAYDANAKKDFVVTKDNIDFRLNGAKDGFVVQVPQKPYLNYLVQLYQGNSLDLGLPFNPVSPITLNSRLAIANQDKNVAYVMPTVAAGEYKVKVTVYTQDAYDKNEIVATKTIKIEGLETVKETREVKASFTDANNNKVRVEWLPATDRSGNAYPTSKYTVYAFDNYTKNFTKVTETIKTSKTKDGANDIYYADVAYTGKFVNEKNNADICYVVVLSDNGKYEKIDSSKLTINRPRLYNNELAVEFDESNISHSYEWLKDSNTLKITIDGYQKDDKKGIPVVKYFTFKKPNDSSYYDYLYNYIVSADYTEVADSEKIYNDAASKDFVTGYTYTIKDVPIGHNVAYQVTISESGKKDFVKSNTAYAY